MHLFRGMLSEPPNTGHYMTLRTSRNLHSCQIIPLLSRLLITSMCHIPVPISLSGISGVMVNNITKRDDKQSTQKSCHEDLWHLFRTSFNHLAGQMLQRCALHSFGTDNNPHTSKSASWSRTNHNRSQVL